MCGICGIYDLNNGPVNPEVLSRMVERLVHRGPDDSGVHVDGAIGLGFRRLSIVDLDSGAQPMTNEDGSKWIVFNGEIYNHQDLRQDLKAKGHVYKTRADTESILHMYEEQPQSFVERLDGMFGFAIWDSTNRSLTVGRDRFGIKPLYYTFDDNRFIFASEIKAILPAMSKRPEINTADLAEFMHFGFLAGGATMFKGIHALLPGHVATITPEGMRTRKYWTIPLFLDNGPDLILSEPEWIERVNAALDRSIKQRFMADVPLGVMLSGGVDSSILSVRGKRMWDDDLDSFNITMPGQSYDESGFAKSVSEVAGTNHHEVEARLDKALDYYWRMAYHNDEPLCFDSAIWIYAVCSLGRSRNEKILLSGEGADEIFGGYIRFRENIKRFRSVQGEPGLHSMTARAGRATGHEDFTRSLSLEEALLMGSAVYSAHKVKALTGTADWENPFRADVLEQTMTVKDPVKAMLAQDQATRLVSLLYRMDKMGMAASVEVRVPFLDHHLAEAMARVPSDHYIEKTPDGLETKSLLKKAAVASGVPEHVVYRPKIGLQTPATDWITDPEGLGRYLVNLMDKDGRGLFDVAELRRMWDEHKSGEQDNRVVLWNATSLEMWAEHFMDA